MNTTKRKKNNVKSHNTKSVPAMFSPLQVAPVFIALALCCIATLASVKTTHKVIVEGLDK